MKKAGDERRETDIWRERKQGAREEGKVEEGQRDVLKESSLSS